MLSAVSAMRGLLVALGFAVTLLPGCRSTETVTTNEYAGSPACGGCHAPLTASWSTSFHHLAMLPAAPGAGLLARPRPEGPLVEAGGDYWMTGSSLEVSKDVPLRYALGHSHVEQFLGDLGGKRLQALPLAWDVRAGEWFDLFGTERRRPEDWGHWSNRGMTANVQCLFCHTTDYAKGYDPATDGYDSTWKEMGVGCEACHGPGSAHVRAQGGAADPYAKPDDDLLLAACGSCHSRRVERAPYRTGVPYLDVFEPELLDSNEYYPDGQVKEELYELISFEMSRMHGEGVRCWDCHDPHGNGTRKPGNELCRTCHEASLDSEAHTHHAAGSAGAQCIGCHMPITVYMQRDPRHDHSFQRPDPQATIDLGIPNACNRCHTERDAPWAVEQMQAWYPNDAVRVRRRAIAAAIAQGRADDAAAVPALLELLGSPIDAVRRASAARLLGRFPTATGVTTALITGLRDTEPLVRAGSAWSLAQRPTLAPDARTALETALDDPVLVVRLHAALGLRDVHPKDLPPALATALAKATAEWRVSQEVGGDTPEAHYNLGIFLAARGDVDGAASEYRAALRLWPTSIQARHNLAMLLGQNGRLDEAARELETLLEHDPVPASAFALGLVYGQLGRWQDAARALQRCLDEDPAYPRARYNLALALAKAGETTRALDELERATDDPASRRDAILTLIDLARQTKDRPRIEKWALEAAKLDPSIAENPEMQELLGR
jgi:predicted CXXCH cytochrome family protein